jgi:UDP-GlcNAc3NAcA epimerase
MIKILTVVGARPQFIKAAALSRVIKNRFGEVISEVILHTGQHYDRNMSQVFFDELDIPGPGFNLGVGSGDHGKQTAQMIEGIEKSLQELKPDFLVVYGDTNSTLAGAIAASKVGIDVVHIEAGLRSFNKSMPEEINRILCDHVSTLLFSPTAAGINNLVKEGFNPEAAPPFSIDNPAIFHCGDVMYDNSLHFAEIAQKESSVLSRHDLKSGKFILGTIHRNNNTDEKSRFTAIFDALNTISRNSEIVIFLPLHPRARKQMKFNLPIHLLAEMNTNPFLKITEPVSFLDMIQLEKHAGMVITDSGGVQKEAYFFEKPSIILRPQTEWVEIVEAGAAILADADKEKIVAASNHFFQSRPLMFPPLFGDGKAAEFICKTIIETHKQSFK